MSRVHDALRRAEQGAPSSEDFVPTPAPPELTVPEAPPASSGNGHSLVAAGVAPVVQLAIHPGMLADVALVPFQPAPESHLLDLNNSHETPAEEFRSLRTRLNHIQTLQPLHTIVVTSPSPAEGKTFSAVNLALAQAHLAENPVLLADFDLRRPSSTTSSRWIVRLDCRII